ncbi:MAG: SPOR domain-containing protein [Terriglobales bacterium]
MGNGPQDTEITLGTGRMLALFFALVVICAGFFAIGFSLGRKATVVGSGNVLAAQSGTPSTVVRPSAGKNTSPPPTPSSGDFSFYKAVEQKNADTKLTPPDSQAQPTASTASTPSNPSEPAKTDENSAAAPAPTNAYYVQVAAVTRQEDADALVEALKKKQYPAFSNNSSGDKYFRVQVGPYADIKDAEIMRGRLIADGYNPILKK